MSRQVAFFYIQHKYRGNVVLHEYQYFVLLTHPVINLSSSFDLN